MHTAFLGVSNTGRAWYQQHELDGNNRIPTSEHADILNQPPQSFEAPDNLMTDTARARLAFPRRNAYALYNSAATRAVIAGQGLPWQAVFKWATMISNGEVAPSNVQVPAEVDVVARQVALAAGERADEALRGGHEEEDQDQGGQGQGQCGEEEQPAPSLSARRRGERPPPAGRTFTYNGPAADFADQAQDMYTNHAVNRFVNVPVPVTLLPAFYRWIGQAVDEHGGDGASNECWSQAPRMYTAPARANGTARRAGRQGPQMSAVICPFLSYILTYFSARDLPQGRPPAACVRPDLRRLADVTCRSLAALPNGEGRQYVRRVFRAYREINFNWHLDARTQENLLRDLEDLCPQEIQDLEAWVRDVGVNLSAQDVMGRAGSAFDLENSNHGDDHDYDYDLTGGSSGINDYMPRDQSPEPGDGDVYGGYGDDQQDGDYPSSPEMDPPHSPYQNRADPPRRSPRPQRQARHAGHEGRSLAYSQED